MARKFLSIARTFIAVAVVGGTLSGCASTVAYIPRDTGRTMAYDWSEQAHESFRIADDCTRLDGLYRDAGWPRGSDLETVRLIDGLVRSRFDYVREQDDRWHSYAHHMLTTQDHFSGDCDDLAATVVSLSRCAGVPRERLGFVFIQANGGDTIDHMIGFYTDGTGASYAIGDTFGRVRPMLVANQEPYAWMFLDRMGRWEKGEGSKDIDFSNPERAYRQPS